MGLDFKNNNTNNFNQEGENKSREASAPWPPKWNPALLNSTNQYGDF